MEDKTLKIQQPEFCKGLGDEVWQYLVHDLKNDNEFRKLCKRYYDAYSKFEMYKNSGNARLVEKEARHIEEIRRQINVRRDGFAMYWIRKYGQAELTLQEVMAVLDDEKKQKFKLRATTMMFLADFMEDCMVEMNGLIKSVLEDGKYEPLKDFFDMRKKVSAYTRQILDAEGDAYQDVFDKHVVPIKMTIYNKVNGFINAIAKSENDNRQQLTFNFIEDDAPSTNGDTNQTAQEVV